MLAAALADVPGAAVAVGADRFAAAHAALARAPHDVALLDDGAQHLRLARDVDVLCVNALTLWGNGRRVPAGPLREAPADALSRAHVVLAHNWPLASPSQRDACSAALRALCRPNALQLRSELAPAPTLRCLSEGPHAPMPLAALRGMPVLCLAAVACPEAVVATLASLGAAPLQLMRFPDHHDFSAGDLRAAADATEALSRTAGAPALLVTTAKDAARLQHDLQQEGLGCLARAGRARVLEGRLRLVAHDGTTDDVGGAAALDALLQALLAHHADT